MNRGIFEILALALVFSALMYGRGYTQKEVSSPTPATVQFAGLPSLGEPVYVDDDSYFSMESLLNESLAERLGDNISLERNGDELIVVMGESISFASGEADLLAVSKSVLRQLASKLSADESYRLVISGHTDNVPIANPVFACNWDLSTARAVAVARYLVGEGIAPERITTQGYAEFRPVADNQSAEGRRRNRRVEIALLRTQLVALR